MLARRPFSDKRSVLACATDIWAQATHEEQMEAIASHPPIGKRKLEQMVLTGQRTAHQSRSAEWSVGEQRSTADGSDFVLSGLEQGNKQYLDKFGFVFLIYATGKSAAQILEQLRGRMSNTAEIEFRIACQELEKIMILRIEKLLDEYAEEEHEAPTSRL